MKKAGRVTFADILKDRDGEGYGQLISIYQFCFRICRCDRITKEYVFNNNFSVVEFAHREDMKYALRELDNARLNGQRVSLMEAVGLILISFYTIHLFSRKTYPPQLEDRTNCMCHL